jgi:hypothetical protein
MASETAHPTRVSHYPYPCSTNIRSRGPAHRAPPAEHERRQTSGDAWFHPAPTPKTFMDERAEGSGPRAGVVMPSPKVAVTSVEAV